METEIGEEYKKMSHTLNLFTNKMLENLWEKIEEGRRGWDNPGMELEMKARLTKHIIKLRDGEEGHEVSIANLAMFLWNLKRKAVE